MATQENHIVRGGKGSTITKGTTPEGKSRLFRIKDDPDPTHEQKLKRAPVRMVIEFDEGELNGEVIRMETTWKEAMLSNAGKPIHSTGVYLPMRTREDEMDGFVAMFQKILDFMANGDIRANEGFNSLPVYDHTGAVIPYTPEQENESPIPKGAPGSYDYVEPVEPTTNEPAPDPVNP